MTKPCCAKPSIANHDHKFGGATVNRVCLHCYKHWYGPVGAVIEYTKAEWDEYMNRYAEAD